MGIEKFETIITCKNVNECVEYPTKRKAKVISADVLSLMRHVKQMKKNSRGKRDQD